MRECPSQTIKVIIIHFGLVTASDMRKHHVLIILTLTFIQCRTALNHENNKCLIISKAIQAMPLTFAVMIVRLKVCLYDRQSDALDLHLRSDVRLKLDYFFNLQYLGQYLSYYIQIWHDGIIMDAIYMLMLVLTTLTLTQGHSGSAKAINQRCMLSAISQY